MRCPCVLALCVLGGCARTHVVELDVPDVEQATDYTCSASALQAVLAYYGTDVAEATLANELGATPADGAPPDAIVRVARAHGLSAAERDGLTVDDIAAEISRRRPMIVDLQAWADKPRADWTDDWDDGHYVIAVAIEADHLVFEDPSLAGSRAVLTRQELESRWHDVDHDRRHIRTGIVFSTSAPVAPRTVSVPARVHMD